MAQSMPSGGRRSRRWTYEQKLAGEPPELALERATERFEKYVGQILREFDRPVKVRAEISVVELPVTPPPDDADEPGDESPERI